MQSSHEGASVWCAAALATAAPALHPQPPLPALTLQHQKLYLKQQCVGGFFFSLIWHVEAWYALQYQLYLVISFTVCFCNCLLKAIVTQCIGKIFIATSKPVKSGTSFTGCMLFSAQFMLGQVSPVIMVQHNCGNAGFT